MFQKWHPLAKPLSSLRSNFETANSKFRPSLSFSPNIPRPSLLLATPPACPNIQQEVPRSHNFLNPNFQILKPRFRSPCFRCGKRGHFANKCKLPPRCFLCGSKGHKRSNCRDLVILKQAQPKLELSRKGGEDDSWMLIPDRGELSKSEDCFLLDPDVAAFFESRVLQEEFSGPLVLQVNGGVSGLERRDVLTQGSMGHRGLRFSIGYGRSGRRLGQKSGIGSSWRSRLSQGYKPHLSVGKGKKLVTHFEMKTGISLWDFMGKEGYMDMAGGFPFPSQVNASRGKSPDLPKESYADLEDSDLDAVSKNDLPPAPLDTISNIIILDVSKDCCCEDKQESSSPRFNNMDHCVDGFATKKKGVSSKKMQGADMPFSVRRSPRQGFSLVADSGRFDMDVEKSIQSTPTKDISFIRLIFSCMIAGGVQYGWALQLSLLTPYVQTLGLSHTLSSLMWLCGPIAGFIVQPIVGIYSDQCRSRYGRRRPFILPGCLLICAAVIIIAFSSDIGSALGDTKEDCSVYTGSRWKAAIIFVAGFWVLDFANNAVQGPARALMADISGKHGCSAGNAIFACWMAVGNILGYSSGSTGDWHKWFPFLQTKACCEACANLKGAFLVAVIFLLICLTVTIFLATETPLSEMANNDDETPARFLDIFKSIKNLPKGMPQVLVITAITWLSWFPFILYDTDWMGREIFHGSASGTKDQVDAFDRGVRAGAFGLLLNSIVLLVGGFLIEPLCRNITARVVWVSGNFMVFLAMTAIAIVSTWSVKGYKGGISGYITANTDVKIVALTIFAFLGLPMSVLFSVPFAVASTIARTKGGGQGLCIGVLNISIVVPQVIIALGAGPWDSLFGKGNLPAFALAAAFAAVGGILGLFMLPRLKDINTNGGGSMH